MAETYGFDPGWTSGIGGLPKEEQRVGPSGLIGLPILQNYLAYGQILDAQKQRERALAEQEQFRQARGALGPGASPEDYMRVAAPHLGPADLMRYGDEWQKLLEARKTREAQQQGLERIMGGAGVGAPVASQPVELGIGQPAGGAPEASAGNALGGRDVSARLDQLKQLAVLYAGNPAQVTAINREIDKLEAPKTEQPSVHVKQDKTSPTGWSYADVKTDKILSQGAPAPASAVGAEPLSTGDLKSLGAEIATGKPIIQVIPGQGRQYADKRLQARKEAIAQIKDELGMDDKQAGVELANRSVDYLAGRKTTTQLSLIRGMTDQAVGQLDFNIKKATEAMDKLPATNLSPILNAIARGEQRWTGNPAYNELFFFMSAAAQESAKILAGGVGSVQQLHQGAQEEAKRWLSINMTPASWKQGIAPAMLAEGRARLRTFDEAIQRQRSGGPTRALPEPPSAPGGRPAPPPGFTPL